MKRSLLIALGFLIAIAVLMGAQDPRIFRAIPQAYLMMLPGTIYVIVLSMIIWWSFSLIRRIARHGWRSVFPARLNGWQRLGCVCSALWFVLIQAIVVIEFFGNYHSNLFFTARSEWTVVQEAPTAGKGEAGAGHWREAPLVESAPGREFLIIRFLVLLFVPVLFAWLLAYTVIAVAKWVIAGFRQ